MAVVISYARELAALLEGFALSERELASGLGTTERTLRRWLAGSAVPRTDARERIEDLTQVLHGLRRSVRADALPKWVRRRVELIGGRRPADLIEQGEVEPLLALADALEGGAFA